MAFESVSKLRVYWAQEMSQRVCKTLMTTDDSGTTIDPNLSEVELVLGGRRLSKLFEEYFRS